MASITRLVDFPETTKSPEATIENCIALTDPFIVDAADIDPNFAQSCIEVARAHLPEAKTKALLNCIEMQVFCTGTVNWEEIAESLNFTEMNSTNLTPFYYIRMFYLACDAGNEQARALFQILQPQMQQMLSALKYPSSEEFDAQMDMLEIAFEENTLGPAFVESFYQ